MDQSNLLFTGGKQDGMTSWKCGLSTYFDNNYQRIF